MRVNIIVEFAVVEEIDASDTSVDLADLDAAEMGPIEAARAVVLTIQDDAARARRKADGGRQARPEADPDAPRDYPLDPEQD